MKLSIIITFYNLEKYVKRNLNSIFNNLNIDNFSEIVEVICINDGSSDNTLQQLLEVQKKQKNMIILNNHNSGVSFSRNAGLTAAIGKYVLFVDGDDYFQKIDYKKLILDIEETDSQLLFFDYISKFKKYEIKYTENVYSNKFNFENHIWNKIFIKRIIDENNLRFKTEIKMGEDMLFLFQYLKYTKKIVKTDSLVYMYDRTRENSIMNNYDYTHMKELDLACEKLKLFANESSSDEYINGIEYVIIKNKLVRAVPKLLVYSLKNKKTPLKFVFLQIKNMNLNNNLLEKNHFVKNDFENYFKEKLGQNYLKRLEELLSCNKVKFIKCLFLLLFHKIIYKKSNEKTKI